MPGAVDEIDVYYRKFFPHATACKLLGRAWMGTSSLHLRELCIETKDAAYIRWQSVSSPEELKELFASKNVEKFHTGAIFDQQPRFRKKGIVLTPTHREFVVDIDVNDYSTWGVDADDIECCDAAWHIVAFGMICIKHIMRHHFGFENMVLTYSGRRGAHLSVYDARACALTDDARAAIVSFMTPSEKANASGRLQFGNMMIAPFFGDMYDTHILAFWKSICLKPRREGGLGVFDTPHDKEYFLELMGDKHAQKTLCLNALDSQQTWNALCKYAEQSKFKESTSRALQETVLTYVWPRIDAAVSKHRNHLSKSWFSVHPKTSRVCIPIFGDPSLFDPSRCPTVTELVAGNKTHRSEFDKASRALASFVERLASSHTESWVPPKVMLPAAGVYPMVGAKRVREDDAPSDPLSEQYMFTDRSRLCYNVNRVFFSLACTAEPTKVCVYWYTSLLNSDARESVSKIYPGYAPPFRERKDFPMDQMKNSIVEASKNPDNQIVATSAYTCVLLHPRSTDEARAASRLSRMQEGLMVPNHVCTVNASWDSESIKSMILQMVKPVWDVHYIHLD